MISRCHSSSAELGRKNGENVRKKLTVIPGSADSSLIICGSTLVYANRFERNITSTLRETTLTSMIQHQQRCSYESSMLLPRGWPAERVINPARIAKRVLSLSVLLLCHGFSAKIEVGNSRDSLEKLTVLLIDSDRYVASPGSAERDSGQ